MLIVDLSPVAAGHLAAALSAHRRNVRLAGRDVPGELLELVAVLSDMARSGLGRTVLDQITEWGDRPPVSPLLLTFPEVAASLRCSERQVRRLVASGQLPAVVSGGCSRVRVSDLEDYVKRLPRRGTSARLEGVPA